MKSLLKQIPYFFFLTLLIPSKVQAIVTLPEELRPDTLPTKTILTLNEPVKVESQIQSILGDILSTAMYLTGGIAIIIIIVAGIRYGISGGDDEKAKNAKNTIKWVVFGLLILLTSLSIIRFVVQLAVGISEL